MLTFTVIAFLAIGTESIPALFAIPFVMFLATVQVVLQLFIFMHLKERGSGYSIMFITAGIFIGVITIAALIHARTL
jgi:cytochrome c oxidase subunit IV